MSIKLFRLLTGFPDRPDQSPGPAGLENPWGMRIFFFSEPKNGLTGSWSGHFWPDRDPVRPFLAYFWPDRVMVRPFLAWPGPGQAIFGLFWPIFGLTGSRSGHFWPDQDPVRPFFAWPGLGQAKNGLSMTRSCHFWPDQAPGQPKRGLTTAFGLTRDLVRYLLAWSGAKKDLTNTCQA